MFDQDLLRTFVTIVDAGSFAAAADAVGRTPSAVSMQIKRLEEQAGRRLLVRGAQGVRLTGDGEMLLVHAREILRAHEIAFDAMMNERSARSLTLGLPDTYVATLLTEVLDELVAGFPDTNLRVVVDGSGALMRRLEEAALDLALVTEYQLGGDERGELVHLERGLWACAEDCPALALTPLPVALMFEGSVFRRLAQEMLRAVARPYRIAVTSNAETVIRAAVASGAVVAPLPESRMAGLRELTPEEGFPRFPPLKVRLRTGRRRLPPAGEWLAQRLIARAAAVDAATKAPAAPAPSEFSP
ncbi:transcriptional regulator, LysR family [Phenylobacterium zucineum HLK1]|uniref:Transcriptional regulator, LysR family n=1 Tax=Phenylobacterium zucineum (strain HLK1) TaxID=450851 RepID=B4R9P2_PHEZH|nr:LysR family transcriptional regulator [Phenylobacterium zucineum]ACG77806.1 transcriptional regulator, LysR family [Phenylobacterium zucineum HLK1]